MQLVPCSNMQLSPGTEAVQGGTRRYKANALDQSFTSDGLRSQMALESLSRSHSLRFSLRVFLVSSPAASKRVI